MINKGAERDHRDFSGFLHSDHARSHDDESGDRVARHGASVTPARRRLDVATAHAMPGIVWLARC
jgi:hypothetical protein